jgi:hypothetical protein
MLDRIKQVGTLLAAFSAAIALGATWHGGCTTYATAASVREIDARVDEHGKAIARVESKIDTMLEILTPRQATR